MKKLILLLTLSLFLTGCSTVKQAQVLPGMDQSQVQLAWNLPQKIESNKNSCCHEPSEESWYYYNTKYQHPKNAKYVYFKDGVVQDVFVWKR